MSRATFEQAEALVEQLTTDEKLRLTSWLERETAKVRLERLWVAVDRRRRGRRFTMAEINREIKAYRRERSKGVSNSGRH